jgi:TonB family protein
VRPEDVGLIVRPKSTDIPLFSGDMLRAMRCPFLLIAAFIVSAAAQQAPISGGLSGSVYAPGAGVTNPVPIYRPEPKYTEEAHKAKLQGSVLLSLVVDETGKAVQIKVVRSLGLGLDERAVEAVSQWKFEPGRLNGKAVPVQAQIEVTFRLLVDTPPAPAQATQKTATSGAAGDSILRNEDIVKLAKAGIDDATILAKVAASKCQFDTSTDALIQLKQSGVSAAVLKAMVAAPTSAPSAPTGGPAAGPSPAAQQSATQQQLEKTVANLTTTIGDLGVQSDRIANNSKELTTLRQLGERNYFEFKLAKTKTPEKVGDVQIKLTSVDPKKNKYTITLIADDKTVEKKDKSINEPVQFYLSKASQPYELVVNQINKDMIIGYVSAPKVQQSREAAAGANISKMLSSIDDSLAALAAKQAALDATPSKPASAAAVAATLPPSAQPAGITSAVNKPPAERFPPHPNPETVPNPAEYAALGLADGFDIALRDVNTNMVSSPEGKIRAQGTVGSLLVVGGGQNIQIALQSNNILDDGGIQWLVTRDYGRIQIQLNGTGGVRFLLTPAQKGQLRARLLIGR